ncbi:MAG: adenylosuccinate synthetase [Gammaproteobacteria bacterium]|nr:adenylosuccinate synthetase [Gammaproteobacteria bacterium]
MPITIVVGGQFGSEGKGKVTHWLAREQRAGYAIRVGGPNSGHTVIRNGSPVVLRQLPTPALTGDVVAVIPAGAYVSINVLLREIEEVGLQKDQLIIDPAAVVIDNTMRAEERDAGLIEAIASTGQGVGSAVSMRTMRRSSITFARDTTFLRRFVRFDLRDVFKDALARKQRVIVEGTQGFGLSVLHGGYYPYATSRDTSAAGALSEAGLSPRDVDCVALTLRAFPIRVGGNSGPLPCETNWEEVSHNSGAGRDLTEYATVTGRPRRVARFHEDIVAQAISVNCPDLLFVNHVDYFDYSIHGQTYLTFRAVREVHEMERRLACQIDHVGVGPSSIICRPESGWLDGYLAPKAQATVA